MDQYANVIPFSELEIGEWFICSRYEDQMFIKTDFPPNDIPTWNALPRTFFGSAVLVERTQLKQEGA